MGDLVWFASYPKSGNTWLRAFVHNFVAASGQPWDINRLGDLTAGEDDAALYAAFDPQPPSTWSRAEVQRLRPLVHRRLRETFNDIVFVKTHNAMLLDGGVPLLTPEVTAGAVYLLRDPRDVAVSYSHHTGLSLDRTIAFMADPDAATNGTDDKVYEKLASWSIHVRSWTARPNPRLHILRYEDMAADPVARFGALVRFLGLDPDPARARLDAAIGFSRFEMLQAMERRNGFVERPAGAAAFFRQGRAGAWRETLTPAQAARIERDHGVEMARFGYR